MTGYVKAQRHLNGEITNRLQELSLNETYPKFTKISGTRTENG
jgi:hypothetical protein